MSPLAFDAILPILNGTVQEPTGARDEAYQAELSRWLREHTPAPWSRPRLRLLDMTVTKRKRLPAPVSMRCRVSGRAMELPGLGLVPAGTEVVLEGKVVDFSHHLLAIRLRAFTAGAPPPPKPDSTLHYAASVLKKLFGILRGSDISASCTVNPASGDIYLHD